MTKFSVVENLKISQKLNILTFVAVLGFILILSISAFDIRGEFIALNKDGLGTAISSQLILMAFVSLVVLLCFITLSYNMSRNLSRRINALTSVMQSLSKRDYKVEVPGTDSKDEVGEIARAVMIFKGDLIEKEIMERKDEAAQVWRRKRHSEIDEVTATFNKDVAKVVGNLANSSSDMAGTSGSMMATAEQTQSQVSVIGEAIMNATSNVHTVAAAAEELSATVESISQQVRNSANHAEIAVRQSGEVDTTVSKLRSASDSVGQIVSLISDIAEQTNLLALNATIEAARAGDAGKGFAVVASEVKSLANQTAKATEEISEQISLIQDATVNATTAIGRVEQTIKDINATTAEISISVEEQGTATREIARSAVQAAESTELVNASIEDMHKAAGMTQESAVVIQKTSEGISHEASTLREEVVSFFASIDRAGERRKHKRIAASFVVTIKEAGQEAGKEEGGNKRVQTIDISNGGMLLADQLSSQIDDVITLEFSDMSIRSTIVGIDQRGTHLRFEEQPGGLEDLLAELAFNSTSMGNAETITQGIAEAIVEDQIQKVA